MAAPDELIALVDTLIPGDARLPRASQVGTHGVVAQRLRATGGRDGLVARDFGLSGSRYRPLAWHLLGTCLMGDDPATSATNRWHQAWDCPNLYVIDGASMVTGAAVNPTSTISALAARTAGHLAADCTTLCAAQRTLVD